MVDGHGGLKLEAEINDGLCIVTWGDWRGEAGMNLCQYSESREASRGGL